MNKLILLFLAEITFAVDNTTILVGDETSIILPSLRFGANITTAVLSGLDYFQVKNSTACLLSCLNFADDVSRFDRSQNTLNQSYNISSMISNSFA
jgi:hypothetical protein